MDEMDVDQPTILALPFYIIVFRTVIIPTQDTIRSKILLYSFSYE